MQVSISPDGGTILYPRPDRQHSGERRRGGRAGPAVADPIVTLERLGSMSRAGFTAMLGDIFEHSPWVADGAFDDRPFTSVAALHAAMTRVVRDAPRDAQLALLRAHPDLAGRAARAGAMTAASVAEQASA